MAGIIPERILLYHLTHFSNLQSIIKEKGLKCYNSLRSIDLDYENIAHNSLQRRRAETQIPCGQGGSLHDYIPFFFCTKPPMLYLISKNNVTDYRGKEHDIIYLVSTVEKVSEHNLSFVFSDGHGIVQYTDFYDDTKYLAEIDWPLMKSQYWYDIEEDPDRKRRRQAEFLLYRFMPWELIIGIAVHDEAMEKKVQTILENSEHRPVLKIKKEWYYNN